MSEFARNWTAEILAEPPMIAPARQYVWPTRIAGEEDALTRGALNFMLRGVNGSCLVTAALGFKDATMPTGIWGCPNANWICAVAGGYAYLADARQPENCTLLEMKPVVAVWPAVSAGLLLFVGFHGMLAWGEQGLAWQTGRLSWEGVRVVSIGEKQVVGFGWDLMKDEEVEFRVELADGSSTGGGWKR